MVEVDSILELIRPGPYYWSTPEFSDARVQLESAAAKEGAYAYGDGVTVQVPVSGKGAADTWLVMKTASDKMKFKSKSTGDEEGSDTVWTPKPSNCPFSQLSSLAVRSCHSPL